MAGPIIGAGIAAIIAALKSKPGQKAVKEAAEKAIKEAKGYRPKRPKGTPKTTASPTGMDKAQRDKHYYDIAVKMGWNTAKRRKIDAKLAKKKKDAKAVVGSATRAQKAADKNTFQAERIALADKGKYSTALTKKRDTGEWKPMTAAAKNLLGGRGLTSGARGGKRVTQPSDATKARTKARRTAKQKIASAGKVPSDKKATSKIVPGNKKKTTKKKS